MKSDTTAMFKRLVRAVSLHKIQQAVREDLVKVFSQLGAPNNAERLAQALFISLLSAKTAEEVETSCRQNLKAVWVSPHKTLLDAFCKDGVEERANIIFGQVSPFLSGTTEPIIDFGCGSGRVTTLLQKTNPNIEGCDVRNYLHDKANFPFHPLQPHLRGPLEEIPDGYFQGGLITNVLHHSNDNEQILKVLARVIAKGKRLVVIETVPLNSDSWEMERTFVIDWFYNRVLHDADIPVPGTFENKFDWPGRFMSVGFELEHKPEGIDNPTDLGYDIPVMPDYHMRYVLVRQ